MNRRRAFFSIYAFFLLCIFLAVAVVFSFYQNIWVDESTQLSGLSLSVSDLYFWLSGLIDNPFPVPSDRMPILSYLVGMAWASVLGSDVLVMRWLSIALVLIGLAVLAVYFYRQRQYLVLCGALTFLCLSPNILVQAVEIRAYALFLLLSLLAIILYLEIVDSLNKHTSVFAKLVVLAVVLAMAINTHFFGIVLTGSVLLTYLLTSFFNRQWTMKEALNTKIVVVVGSILLLAIAFIVLPVMGSFTSQEGAGASVVGGSSIADSLIKPMVKLVYRLVSHQTLAVWLPLSFTALVLVYGVITYAFLRRVTVVKLSLLLMIIIGFAVISMANLFLSNFNALAPHYNIWMVPIIALLFAYSLVDLPRWAAISALGLLIICLGSGTYQLVFVGEKYAHNRFDQVEQRVEQYQPTDNIAIVYQRSMAKTWFAGLYRFENQIEQFSISPAGFITHLLTGQEVSSADIVAKASVLIVVSGNNIYTSELVAAPVQSALPITSLSYTLLDLPSSQWQLVDSGLYMAQESAEIAVYKKSP